MKYIGKFRDKKDTLHTITITTKVGTGTTNIVLGTSPFVEDLEGDGISIFKPCKYSSATVRILAKDYMWDLYQSKAQDVSVVLTDEGGNVEWTGFVTPNLYDMGYESDKEELEIECIDALSTLQYFKYTAIGDKPRTNSFLDIIKHIFKNKTPYIYMYFPSFLQGITLDKLKICEQNFFDQDGDDWTMQEVLEEICRYLNVTCVASGNSVYFLNYGALGKVNYLQYGIASGTVTPISFGSTNIIKKEDTTLFSKAYAGNWHIIGILDEFTEGTIKLYVKHTNTLIWQEEKLQISYKNGIASIRCITENKGDITYPYIDRIAIVRNSEGVTYIQIRNHTSRSDYSNVRLKISFIGLGFNTISEYRPGAVLSGWAYSYVYDATPSKVAKGDETDLKIENANSEGTYTIDGNSYSEGGGTISLMPSFNQISVTSKINEYKDLLPDVFDDKYLQNINGDWNKVLKYSFVEDSSRANSRVVEGRYKFVQNQHYKTYYYDKTTGEQLDLDSCKSYEDLQNTIGATLISASFQEYQRPYYDDRFKSSTNKSLTNYILIHQHDTTESKLVFSTVASEIPETFIGKSSKIIIKGNLRCLDRENKMYIADSYSSENDSFNGSNLCLRCKLKWGDYYFYNYRSFDGSDESATARLGKWSTEEKNFLLYFNASDTSHLNNKDFSIMDTSGDYLDADLPSGYVIPLPESVTTQGSIPEFYIYTDGRMIHNCRMDSIWLKDFSISLAVSKESNIKESEWETDTKYTNIINEDYVEEGEEIECKINTWDNKAPTYSVVMYSDGGNQYYLDTVRNLITGNTFRMEEHIIYDYVTQYKQPSILLNVSLKQNLKPYTIVTASYLGSSKRFIVDSYSRDYYSCNNNIKLVEKWNL